MDNTLHIAPGGSEPARIALFGAGGYGVELARLISKYGMDLEHPIVIDAVFDTQSERSELLIRQPGLRHVRVMDSAQAVANDPAVDAVWLPLPIHLHAEFTEMMLDAGKAVMIEKPVAASVAELDRMIRARDRSGRVALVGFQEIYDPSTLQLKHLLLSGELGAVQRITVRACWPRSATYFSRNGWAGRRRVKGRSVHDSPLSNALAHFANLALYLAGKEVGLAARPTDVRARPYRCAAIDNFDTVAIDAQSDAGTQLLFWLTHASASTDEPVIHIRCEHGLITRSTFDVLIERPGKPVERWLLKPRDRKPMLAAWGAALHGSPLKDRALASLELSRPHVELIEAVAGFPIREVDESRVETIDHDGEPVRAICGIERWFEQQESAALKGEIVRSSPGHDPDQWLDLPDAIAHDEQGEGYERTA